jgi:hypothetical protein
VLRAIPKGIQFLHKRLKKRLECRIRAIFYNMEDGPWQSADGVVGELYLKAALSDAKGFLAPKLKGWRATVQWFRLAPYRWRHAFRRAFVIPGRDKADKVLCELWERGLLVRARWDHTNDQFYRLKN